MILAKSIISIGILLTSLNLFAETPALKCYAFMGVNYKTLDYNGWEHEVDDNTKLMFENTTPIVNGGADIVLGNNNFIYDAHLASDYFRLELTDKTNGQSSEYFGPSSSFETGVDTVVFMKPANGSGVKPSWDDLENKIGDVVVDSLKLRYLTVQCNKIDLGHK